MHATIPFIVLIHSIKKKNTNNCNKKTKYIKKCVVGKSLSFNNNNKTLNIQTELYIIYKIITLTKGSR
jgi:hypothetical protein